MKHFILLLLTSGLLMSASCTGTQDVAPTDGEHVSENEVMALSIRFLDALRAGEPTETIAAEYAVLPIDVIAATIDTESEKLAFWVNTYNAFVQHILTNDPSKFDDRGAFFGAEQIAIGGEMMSLDQIEHGIIRANRWKISLGHLKKPFPKSYVRKLRTDTPDGRVHLALNCGALSCPAIAIYTAQGVDEELDIIAKRYLDNTTVIEGDVVTVTPLMSWFRVDFGGKKGIKKDYLKAYGIVEETDDITLQFGRYDWTLSLGNYTDL